MAMPVKVSVITVCFNSEKTIERTLQSVLNQTYQNIEYILIDGKSSDHTLEIIQRYESRFNGRLTYLSEPDQGIYDAMNKGIRLASGELIGLINSDDFYESDAIEHILSHYDPHVLYQVIYGQLRVVDQNKAEKVVFIHHDQLNTQMIPHPTCFVSSAVYRDFGGFNLEYRSASDLDFMLRLYHDGKTSFIPVDQIIATFHDGGMSTTKTGVRETAKIRLKYGTITQFQYLNIRLRSFLLELIKKVKN